MIQGLILSRGKRFSSSPKCIDGLWGPHSLVFRGYWLVSLGGNWPERETAKSSSAEVKNEWSYTATPYIHFHGMYRNIFTCRSVTCELCRSWRFKVPYSDVTNC
jgi:hypothetical protein